MKHIGSLVLRPYARGDLDAMFRLDQECFAEPFRFTKSAMQRFAQARNALVCLALAEEQLAGFVVVHLEEHSGVKEAYLLTLDVAPDFRRIGLARRLLDEAERKAREAGSAVMALHVFADNAAAISLYEKLGYQRLTVEENFYGRGLHGWVYRKSLL